MNRRASSTATGGGGDVPRSPSSPSGVDRPASGRSVSAGQLTEDLRRRLALGGVGGSNASLSSLQHDGSSVPRSNESTPTNRQQGATSLGLGSPINLNPGELHLKRTVSQTDTEISDVTASTSTSSFSNPTTSPATGSRPPARSRVRLSGVEVAKVSPAVAEDSTNAMGLFDVDARYREGSEAEAGESVAGTELNSAAGPLGKNTGRRVVPPERWASTYGTSHCTDPPAILPSELMSFVSRGKRSEHQAAYRTYLPRLLSRTSTRTRSSRRSQHSSSPSSPNFLPSSRANSVET